MHACLSLSVPRFLAVFHPLTRLFKRRECLVTDVFRDVPLRPKGDINLRVRPVLDVVVHDGVEAPKPSESSPLLPVGGFLQGCVILELGHVQEELERL